MLINTSFERLSQLMNLSPDKFIIQNNSNVKIEINGQLDWNVTMVRDDDHLLAAHKFGWTQMWGTQGQRGCRECSGRVCPPWSALQQLSMGNFLNLKFQLRI